MPSKVRARILRAAEAEFAECGFRGASTRSIARAADVHETSIFRLFETKEKLFHEVFNHALERALQPQIAEAAMSAKGWKGLVIALAKATAKSWTVSGARILQFATLEYPNYFPAVVQQSRAYVAPLHRRVQELQETGYLRRGDPARMVESIMDVIYMLYVRPMVYADERRKAGLPPKQADLLIRKTPLGTLYKVSTCLYGGRFPSWRSSY